MTLYTILDQTEEAGTVGIPGFCLTNYYLRFMRLCALEAAELSSSAVAVA